MVASDFLREVEDACDAALVEVGYKRPRRGTRVLEITSEFLGWVGLNQGRHENYVRINPFVGIHCIPLMRMCKELAGDKYQKGRIATVAVHLGELCPDVEQFVFQPGEPVEPEARRLSIVIGEYGFPWMKERANYEALLPMLLGHVSSLGGYPERAAAAYFLMGKHEEARDFIQKQRDRFTQEHCEYAPYFESVAVPLIERIEAETSS